MPPTRWFSLRRRLLALLLGGVSAAWLVTVVFSYHDAHHEIDELFDAQLAQAGQALLALASETEAEHIEDIGANAHKYQRQLRFQIWHGDGSLVLRSRNAPETPLTTAEGFAETDNEDGHWRHFSQWNASHSLQVQVSENHNVRDELIARIAWRVLLPALFVLPLLGLWMWVATRRTVNTLDQVADQIAARAPEQLQAVEPAAAPAEIRPLLEALNALFARVEQALAAEKRFTADAAHELRTPLAGLQAQLQVALRARDEAEREHSFHRLQTGLARASHLVDQMLQLARLDPESGLPDPQAVDLAALAESVCGELGTAILEKSLDFELLAPGKTIVPGQPEWLRVLIRNLVDNALRYTPPGGKLRVTLGQTGGRPWLQVADSGPGIAPEQREAALQRFRRLDQQGLPGSGLGLSIVARIAELHGASLSLSDSEPAPGLTVTVHW